MNEKRFAGDTAVVTGSTRGIGATIASRLAEEGANVVVTGRSTEDGERVVAEIEDNGGEARFVHSNMRDPDEIAALFEVTTEAYGGLTVLVNNAGVETHTAVDEATIDDWESVLETDFRAYWFCAKHAIDHIEKGAIVNISSNHALGTTSQMFPYNAVKAGIDGMTRAMALDFGPHVRVNTVNPGLIAIERTTGNMDTKSRLHLESIHPVGRLGSPEDVAAAVTFLASEEAGFVTGTQIVVDGGRTAVMQDDALPDYRDRRHSS